MPFTPPEQPYEAQLVELLRPLSLKYSNRVTVTKPAAQSWTVGKPVTLQLEAVDSDTTITTFEWTIRPTLPLGMSLDAATGKISGTPITTDSARVYTVRAADWTTARGEATFLAGVVEPNRVVVGSLTPRSDWAGDTISVQPTATDSDPSITTFTWTAAGLPAGVTISSSTGAVTGTLTTPQTGTTATLTATDSTGAAGSAGFGWTVKGGVVSLPTIPDQTNVTGDTVSVQPAASDTNPNALSFTWTASGLPAGVTISSSTGKIAGSPTAAQTSKQVTITATDAYGAAGTTSFGWTVTAAT